MRKMGIVLLMLLVFIAALAYFKNDGLYIFNKNTRTEIELLREYTDVQFPDSIIINEMRFETDIESYFFSHNEEVKAAIMVPSIEIDKLFPEKFRMPSDFVFPGHKMESGEERKFTVFITHTVEKWFDKTQRSIYFTVMQPKDENTIVYVFVDKLGWNISNK